MPTTPQDFDTPASLAKTAILAEAANIVLQRLQRLWYVANVFRSHPIRRASIRCPVEGGM
jgi:hypothetical protein